jgi:hypothetical protein
MTCEPAPRFLIEKGCRAIWGFHRQSRSRALPYFEALARRWRYGITVCQYIDLLIDEYSLRVLPKKKSIIDLDDLYLLLYTH